MKRILFVLASLLAASPLAFAADDSPIAGVRTTVPLVKAPPCDKATSSVKDLGEKYYTTTSSKFVEELVTLLEACDELPRNPGYLAVVFAVKPATGADAPTIVHVLLHLDGSLGKAHEFTAAEVSGLPGVDTLSWVVLADCEDKPKIVLHSTAIENPLLAQIGPLAAKVLGSAILTRLQTQPATPKPVFLWRANNIRLPFKRAKIVETDIVNTPDAATADTTFFNVPHSYLTLHAGVGVLTGSIRGARPATIDNDRYISDPLNRAATIAGVALHWPFDSTSPTPTFAERLGFVVGGVITPAGGWYLGPSYGWRGFSITAGVAWMWVHTTPPDFAIGDSVKKNDTGSVDQLVYGKVHAVMVGGTYVFGQ